jgi:hypothetical protein
METETQGNVTGSTSNNNAERHAIAMPCPECSVRQNLDTEGSEPCHACQDAGTIIRHFTEAELEEMVKAMFAQSSSHGCPVMYGVEWASGEEESHSQASSSTPATKKKCPIIAS